MTPSPAATSAASMTLKVDLISIIAPCSIEPSALVSDLCRIRPSARIVEPKRLARVLHRLTFEALAQPVANERVNIGFPYRASRLLRDRAVVMLVGKDPQLGRRLDLIEQAIHLV